MIPNLPPKPRVGSDLLIPGQSEIGFQHLPGPLAQAVAVTVNNGNGIRTIIHGGLTTRMQLAVALAPTAMEFIDLTKYVPGDDLIASRAFELADSFLRHEALLRQAEANAAALPAPPTPSPIVT
ncbi:MAG: hypothetical protein EHM42_11825 [Planctomycetaceae bacterium]|nr:MAG: hypothetical protein EHM42_11825 [Planctomycetaceae bacterium]